MSILPYIMLGIFLIIIVIGWLLICSKNKPHPTTIYEYPMFDESEFEGDMAGFVQGLNTRKDG